MDKPRNKTTYKILVFDTVHSVNTWDETNPASIDNIITWRIIPRAWVDQSGGAHLDMNIMPDDPIQQVA